LRPTTIAIRYCGGNANPRAQRPQTNPAIRPSDCDNRTTTQDEIVIPELFGLYNSMQVLPPPTQYRGIVVESENTQHRVIQHKQSRQTKNSLATATSAAAAWSRLTTGSMQLTAEAVR
jgi:hypothetical protein